MRVIRLTATAGPDGRVRFEFPAEPGRVYEVAVTVAEGPAADGAVRTPTPEELGWPPGYFEATAGASPDFSVEPRDQGEHPRREEL